MRFLAAYALRGRLQALAAICGLALASLALPPFSLLSSALLGLVALRQGAKESAWILLLSLLGLGLSTALLNGNAFPGLVYGVLLWLPVWPMALLLRETRRLDWAMEAATGLGMIFVIGVYLLISDPAAMGREKLQQLAQPMLENAPANFDASALTQALDLFSHFLAGAMVGSSVISLILSLLIARWLQALLFNPGGFRSEFVDLRLHPGVAYATLACLAVGIMDAGVWSEAAWNLSLVVFMLSTLGGFAIVHALLGSKRFWIVGVYFALVFAPQFLIPPVALLSLSDPWLNWRKLSKRP